MFCSLLVFWLIVADSFLVTLISASLWELFAHSGDRGLSWGGLLSGTRGAGDVCILDMARD